MLTILSILFEEKNAKLVKQSKMIFQQQKTLENPNIVDIKSVFVEHRKYFLKLSKIIKQAKNV